jgi:hypothetical protein
MARAKEQLKQADDAYAARKDKKVVIAAARNAVETAEEARVIAVQKKAEEDAQLAQDAERKAAAEREARARANAEAEALRRQEADQARAQAEAEKADAERMKQQADQAAQQAAQQQQQAEAASAAARAQQQAAEAEAEKARQAAAQAEQDKAAIRAQLLAQLNAVLQTQDTATRADREHVGCAVRYWKRDFAGPGTGKAGQDLRYRDGASGVDPADRGAHGQRGRRPDEPTAFGAARRFGAGFSDLARGGRLVG